MTVCGQPVACTPDEFQVLATLAAVLSSVFTRRQLISLVHGTQGYVTARTVDIHIMNLRKKIEADARLLTVYGVGYKLTVEGNAGASHL